MKRLSPSVNHTEKGNQFYNVKAYGAKGDNSTNDTAAIQAAFDAANADGGGTVFFPVGTYRVSMVYGYTGVSILGADVDKTIVKRINLTANNSTNSEGAINYHGDVTTKLQRFSIRNITADGNRGGISAGTGSLVDNEAFSFIYCRNFFIENCRGMNAPGEGFDLDYCYNATIMGCYGLDNGGNGFHASLESDALKFIGNYAYGNGLDFDRSGFDQYTSATNCIYIGNISASNNYRNFNIDGAGAICIGNKSLGSPPQADVWSGVTGSGLITSQRTGGTITRAPAIIMSGWSYIVGNGAQNLTHSLIIPEDVDEIISLNVSYLGGRTTVSGTPATIEDFNDALSSNYGTIGVTGINKTTKVASVTLSRLSGSTWSTNYNYGYSWIAVGRKKQ